MTSVLGTFDLDSPSLTSDNREVKERIVTTNHREVCWALLSRENAAQTIRSLFLSAVKKTNPDITSFYVGLTAVVDLRWWHRSLSEWNGIQLLVRLSKCDQYYMWTAASGVIGIKGYILDENAVQTTIDDISTVRLVTCHQSKIFS